MLPQSAKYCFFILQIIPSPYCRCLSVTLSCELLKLSPSLSVFPCFLCSFGFLWNSPHFVLTLTFLDCFVFLSMIFDQSSSNFFWIMCCLYLLEWFFFNLSAIMCFRWSRACSFPFQEPNTTSFRTFHLLLFPPFLDIFSFFCVPLNKFHAVFQLCIYVFVIEAIHHWGCHMRSSQTLGFHEAFTHRRPISTQA